jgi:hypothetical protein
MGLSAEAGFQPVILPLFCSLYFLLLPHRLRQPP